MCDEPEQPGEPARELHAEEHCDGAIAPIVAIVPGSQ
jgi:hypothetical protein